MFIVLNSKSLGSSSRVNMLSGVQIIIYVMLYMYGASDLQL